MTKQKVEKSFLELGNIIDVPEIQGMMDSFYKLNHIPMAIVDVNGKVLVGVGWQKICTCFHRKNPQTCRFCVESDTELTAGIPKGEFKLYKCKNNMWDMASPIYVGEKHLGSIFIGQFFFDDEKIDYDFFRSQAQKYGFDENQYLTSLDSVPRVSRAYLDALEQFFLSFAQNISKLSYTNIQLASALSEKEQLTESLQLSKRDLNRAQSVSHIGSWRLNVRNNDLTWSDETYRIFGIADTQTLTYESFVSFVHPDDKDFVNKQWKAALAGSQYDIEHRIIVDGQIKWVREKAKLEFGETGELLGGFGTVQDITEIKKTEKELARLASFPVYNPLPVVEADIDGNISFINPTAQQAMPDIKKMGRNHPWMRDWDNLVSSLNKNAGKFVRETRINGSCFLQSIYFEPNSRLIRIYGIDITELQNSRQMLINAHEQLEQKVQERTKQLAETIDKLHDEIKLRTDAEKKAAAERKRFQDVLEMLPAYAILLTPDYHVAYANKFFEERFGKDNGKRCYEYLFNRTEPCENCKTFDVFKTGKPNFWEWIGPDERNYDIYDYPFTDTDGSPMIMEIGLDATMHKNALKSLNQSSLYARGLIEASVDPLVTISHEGKITDVNKATEEVTGVPRQKLIGSDFSNYFTEPQKAKHGYELVLSENQVKDYPLSIRHKSGRITDVIYNATVYKNQAGEVQGVFAAARDITKRKAAEEKQNFTNLLLELFAKKTNRKDYLDSCVSVIHSWSGCEFVGIRIGDDSGNIPYESYIGFDQDFLNLENSLHVKDHDCICIRTILKNSLQCEKMFRTHGNSFFCNDSHEFVKSISDSEKKQYRANCIKWGFQSIAVIPVNYQNKILGAIHIADFKKDMVPPLKIDFIESTIAPLIGEAIQRFNAEAQLDEYRRNLEEKVVQRTQELARSNKDLEQFAYVASHDLQEPLRAVAGFVELLKMQLGSSLSDKNLKYMNFVVDGVIRMQALIHGLLEYSRIGTRFNQSQPVDTKKAINHAMAYLERAIQESRAEIIIGDLPTVCMDELLFVQLFQNLIGNAIKFKTAQKPQIHIDAEKLDGFWKFWVKDNGIGLEQEYAERIFLIFQRLHTRDKYPGTGIGLSICKKIVERHGGKIWVESQPGQGSTFYFTIPEIGAN
ncbi:MAG: PocR ligand-binding domain-containing protein [Phycisphaerales bacterium]